MNIEGEGRSSVDATTLALLDAARRGQRSAENELFRRLLPEVRSLVASRTWNRGHGPSAREDIVQETLFDLLRVLKDVRAETVSALRQWLASAVENNLKDDHRRRVAGKRDCRRLVPAPCSDGSGEWLIALDVNTPSRFAQAAELKERVERLLSSMEPAQRRVIELRQVHSLPFETIARELGLGGASSARSLYSRTLGELADRL